MPVYYADPYAQVMGPCFAASSPLSLFQLRNVAKMLEACIVTKMDENRVLSEHHDMQQSLKTELDLASMQLDEELNTWEVTSLLCPPVHTLCGPDMAISTRNRRMDLRLTTRWSALPLTDGLGNFVLNVPNQSAPLILHIVAVGEHALDPIECTCRDMYRWTLVLCSSVWPLNNADTLRGGGASHNVSESVAYSMAGGQAPESLHFGLVLVARLCLRLSACACACDGSHRLRYFFLVLRK